MGKNKRNPDLVCEKEVSRMSKNNRNPDLVCEKEVSRMGKNNENPDLVCENKPVSTSIHCAYEQRRLGQYARMHRLAGAIAGRICDNCQNLMDGSLLSSILCKV